MLADKQRIIKILTIIIILFVVPYSVISFFMRPNISISAIEGPVASEQESTKEYLEIEINTSNPIHKLVYFNKVYIGEVKVDSELYETITLELSEQYKVYLDSQDLDRGQHNIEITITDISTPKIVYGRKELDINLSGASNDVQDVKPDVVYPDIDEPNDLRRCSTDTDCIPNCADKKCYNRKLVNDCSFPSEEAAPKCVCNNNLCQTQSL